VYFEESELAGIGAEEEQRQYPMILRAILAFDVKRTTIIEWRLARLLFSV
jgi:hypothetical protein